MAGIGFLAGKLSAVCLPPFREMREKGGATSVEMILAGNERNAEPSPMSYSEQTRERFCVRRSEFLSSEPCSDGYPNHCNSIQEHLRPERGLANSAKIISYSEAFQ